MGKKATGIVRKVDELHRIVIPQGLCRTMGIDSGTPIEIFTDEDDIILRKYHPGCIFCGDVDGLAEYAGKKICPICAAAISKQTV